MAKTLLRTYEQLMLRNINFQARCWTVRGQSRPKVCMRGESYNAARVVAALFHGLDLDDPDQLACHECDNPRCIRPSHIYVGTKSTNTRDHIVRSRA